MAFFATPSSNIASCQNKEIHSFASGRSFSDPPRSSHFPFRNLIKRASPHEAMICFAQFQPIFRRFDLEGCFQRQSILHRQGLFFLRCELIPMKNDQGTKRLMLICSAILALRD